MTLIFISFSNNHFLNFFFFFNDTATTEIYTLSLHDAPPISGGGRRIPARSASSRRIGCPRNPCSRSLVARDERTARSRRASRRRRCVRTVRLPPVAARPPLAGPERRRERRRRVDISRRRHRGVGAAAREPCRDPHDLRRLLPAGAEAAIQPPACGLHVRLSLRRAGDHGCLRTCGALVSKRTPAHELRTPLYRSLVCGRNRFLSRTADHLGPPSDLYLERRVLLHAAAAEPARDPRRSTAFRRDPRHIQDWRLRRPRSRVHRPYRATRRALDARGSAS